jgi:hypothetical protein
MKKLVFRFKNQGENIHFRDAVLTTIALVLSISLNGQNSPDSKADKSSFKPAIDVVINDSMIKKFNDVIFDDEHAGLQHLIKDYNMEDIGIILQTMNVEEISKATTEQLKNVVEVNKSTMKLQVISVKKDQKLNTIAVIQ